MSKKVLILDDDVDFNTLLTDIYEQGDYDVTSLYDPLEAVEQLKEGAFDVIVSDHKMPEMSGSEFVKVAKGIAPEVPVIMVSGFLENETIRNLIKDGVDGIFLKPLNVFSLLERTAELIRERAGDPEASHDASSAEIDCEEALGFRFKSFPCKSPASIEFAKRLHSLRSFKTTLTLTGEQGTHFERVCEDIRAFETEREETFLYFDKASFSEAEVLAQIIPAVKVGNGRVTCVLLNLEEMSEAQRVLASQLAKQEGSFALGEVELRAVFCIVGDIDLLFDAGIVDENLYMLMGTAEVAVPPLRSCSIDLGVMAQQIAAQIARESQLPAVPRFESAARDLLRRQLWKNNYREFWHIIKLLVEHSEQAVVGVDLVSQILQHHEAQQSQDGQKALQVFLEAQTSDLQLAVEILCDRDLTATAQFFDRGEESATA